MGEFSTRVWELLENWAPGIFLLSGLLVLVGTVVIALQLVVGDPTFLKNPFEFSPYLGLILSYFGLLGLYPRLADHVPLARVSVVLLFVPVVVMVIYIATAVAGTGLPFSGIVSVGAFVLFTLGISLFGIGSYRTGVPTPGVGLSLLAVAAAWLLVLGSGLVTGFPIPQPIVFASAVIMAVAFLTIGYLLRTDGQPGDRTQPASDTTL